MNQILMTSLSKKFSNSKQYKILFVVSILAILFFLVFYLIYNNQLQKEKIFSTNLSQNYQVFRTFSTNTNPPTSLYNDSDILGKISIPKLDISYPFFYGINEELLKISPCRFWGEMPNKYSNLCIAGHNYDDNRFFSKISNLSKDDLIQIEDNYNNVFNYFVYDKFEIDENEIDSILTSSPTKHFLTLLTCNNKNKKRIIVKAKQ